MANKIGRFEILSEITHSEIGAVYKAADPESGQTIALKTIKLQMLDEQADVLVDHILQEAAGTKPLSSHNIAQLFGVEVIDDQCCAAEEYVQGNSIATMLARKEGFSIWDLLDIGRQVCSGLDHAHSHKVFHYSLEPAKIMCGWDGTVRILSYGVSSIGKFTAQMTGVPPILPYMSPEQVRGENIDARSNFFSLGAMFYEMVADRKAFDREDADSLRQSILESSPTPPMHLNPKLHPVLSDLIMKALAKDPSERYQSGRELLDDLEKCKESKPQAAKAATAPAKTPVIPDAVKAANQAKFVGASAPPAAPRPTSAASVPSRLAQPKPPAAQPVQSSPVQNQPVLKPPAEKKVAPPPPAFSKASAAAAGCGPGCAITDAVSTAPVKVSSYAAPPPPAAVSSAVVDEPAVVASRVQSPKIAVDPMMSEDNGSSRGGSLSFSEMTELPPLKEVYTAPPPPPQTPPPPPVFGKPASQSRNSTMYEYEEEKPKVQPREVAQKALKEVKNLPPSLMVYSIAGAAVVILIIAVVLVLHVNSLNSDNDSPRSTAESTAAESTKQPAPSQPVARTQSVPQQAQPPEVTQAQPVAPVAEAVPASTHAAAKSKNGKKKAAAPVVAPIVVPGQMSIDSVPQGAQVSIDGKTDPTWVTPFTLPGLDPGQHSVTASKSGYSSDTRTVEVASGSKSFVVNHLTQLMATLAVSSTPAGASVYIDGKDTGKQTPAQVSLDKGSHVVLVRKSGYLDETTNAQFTLGQTVNFSSTLRLLGNVDDIKTVGKMNKLFGGKDTKAMGSVSVKTQPKGAQVAVNQHMLDKAAPVDFTLDPGNYVVDITMSGYVSVHKIITVDKGGKAVIDEVLKHE
jgi:eukaryotic-like serine/threonine-protein kinase